MQKFFEKHRELQARRAEEGFDGFTLIELLIVIVVLGILAATVIFALSNIQGSSAQASCNSDAKSVEVAVTAYHALPANDNGWPATVAALVPTYLRTAPGNTTHYVISTDGSGGVFVNPAGAAVQDKTTNYDSTTNPCNLATIK
jgi:general secretion pathway protein G